jgi:hypothetical protein
MSSRGTKAGGSRRPESILQHVNSSDVELIECPTHRISLLLLLLLLLVQVWSPR